MGCEEEESVEYVIMICRKYETERGDEGKTEGERGAGVHIKKVIEHKR